MKMEWHVCRWRRRIQKKQKKASMKERKSCLKASFGPCTPVKNGLTVREKATVGAKKLEKKWVDEGMKPPARILKKPEVNCVGQAKPHCTNMHML